MAIKQTILKNGIRILTDERKGARAVGICVACHYGAGYEKDNEKGITHMMEHMLFLGTQRKTNQEIETELAKLGAVKDGLTGAYCNYYPIRVLKEDVEKALDIWAEILQESVFPVDKFDKEKQVVLREIDMVLDSPDRRFGELWLKTAYPKSQMKYSAVGTQQSVSSFTVDQVRKHWKKCFANNVMVIAAQGGITHQKFVELCSKKFNKWSSKLNAQLPKPDYKGGLKHEICIQNQEWVFVGFRVPGYLSKDNFVSQLIWWIMAKGFLSRLYRSIRGRGLAYLTTPSGWEMEPISISGVKLKVSPENVYEVIHSVVKECATFAQTVTQTELQCAQKQIVSRILLQEDRISNDADDLACFPLNHLDLVSPAARIKCYQSVTLKDIKRVAKKIFSGAPTVAIMGPKCKTPSYKTICKWLKGE